MEVVLYKNLLDGIKKRIHQAQAKALFAVNTEMIQMYDDIGNIIIQQQALEGWGKGIISQIAADLKNEFSEVKGFSERNLGYMVQFAREYANVSILQQPVAKLPWGHTIALMQKIKDVEKRDWYALSALHHNWGRDTQAKIKTAKAELEKKVIAQYPTLTIDEIKTVVVEKKWMANMEQRIRTEMDNISHRLTQRIKELADRYETPMPQLAKEVRALEEKVNAHLQNMGFVWK